MTGNSRVSTILKRVQCGLVLCCQLFLSLQIEMGRLWTDGIMEASPELLNATSMLRWIAESTERLYQGTDAMLCILPSQIISLIGHQRKRPFEHKLGTTMGLVSQQEEEAKSHANLGDDVQQEQMGARLDVLDCRPLLPS